MLGVKKVALGVCFVAFSVKSHYEKSLGKCEHGVGVSCLADFSCYGSLENVFCNSLADSSMSVGIWCISKERQRLYQVWHQYRLGRLHEEMLEESSKFLVLRNKIGRLSFLFKSWHC